LLNFCISFWISSKLTLVHCSTSLGTGTGSEALGVISSLRQHGLPLYLRRLDWLSVLLGVLYFRQEIHIEPIRLT
jgi:hypothetical protein